MPRKARWKHLLEENQDFRRWYENLARGSSNTAELNARTLYRFGRLADLTPSKIVEVAREDRREFENVLLDFVTRLREEGKAPSYIENYLTCVRSWLQFNDVNLVRKIKIGNTNRTPTIEDERIPTKEELRQILNYAQERGRCSISFIGFSGLRPQALGNSTGIDGLEMRDLPEMEIKVAFGGIERAEDLKRLDEAFKETEIRVRKEFEEKYPANLL